MNYQIVIPARGGSKRLVGKNCVDFGGIPLIAHSIKFAQNELSESVVYVNTEDPVIASVAKSFGAEICSRPLELAQDTSTTAEVLRDQIRWFEQNEIPCDAIILLQATNPIRPEGLLKEAVSKFEHANRSSLASFSVLHKKFGTIDSKNFFIPENYSPGQRMQDLTPRYYENGLIYITKKESLEAGEIITSDVFPLIIDHLGATVDIDEPDDLIYANFIIEHLKNHE